MGKGHPVSHAPRRMRRRAKIPSGMDGIHGLMETMHFGQMDGFVGGWWVDSWIRGWIVDDGQNSSSKAVGACRVVFRPYVARKNKEKPTEKRGEKKKKILAKDWSKSILDCALLSHLVSFLFASQPSRF